MDPASGPARGGRRASGLALGLVILAAGHGLLYVLLTGEARASLASLQAQRPRAELEQARDPGSAPQPGGEAYSAWLRAYETWCASREHALHGRHAAMVGVGIVLSFLIGLGLLGQGMLRASRARGAARRAGSTPRQRARAIPLRPVPAQPGAVRHIALRPAPVARRRSA